eukprot:TRINITY_DN11554_c0_g1_i1.p1 TRINITY_DN11554_c0_g1~~TRINITY_DN11554_c0_g1_i1.p1  ORF type:complete len:647 (+),score=145.72 TRINITY_DN11554_c0_g1_i1:57-1943(+)
MDVKQDEDCSICLDSLKNGKALFQTGCGHTFHFSCIKASVQADNGQCPLCRQSFRSTTPPVDLPAPVPIPPPVIPVALTRRASAPRRPVEREIGIPLDDPVGPFAALPVARSADYSADVRLSCSSTTEFSSVVAQSSAPMFAMVTIKAPACPIETSQRAPMDLVCVVDRSGSMEGPKEALVKQTLHFILTQLLPHDRLSICSFDGSPYLITGLRKMTDVNKSYTGDQINTHPDLIAQGSTSISLGLKLALDVLRARRTTNPVTSILLLTDGEDDSARNDCPVLLRDGLPENATVFTFGFGARHDAAVMMDVAECGHGMFTFIEQLGTVGQAFANCIGGLLSVVAQGVKLSLRLAPSVQLIKMHSKYKTEQQGDGAENALVVHVGDMFADEQRDIVIELKLPACAQPLDEPQQLLQYNVRYDRPTLSDTVESEQQMMTLLRPAEVQQSDLVINRELDKQRCRVLCAEALQRAIAAGEARNYAEARSILQTAVEAIRRAVSGTDPMCLSLLRDLQQCASNMTDHHTYQETGSAMSRNCFQMHSAQRSSTIGDNVYRTPSMASAMAQTPRMMTPTPTTPVMQQYQVPPSPVAPPAAPVRRSYFTRMPPGLATDTAPPRPPPAPPAPPTFRG